MSSSREVRRLFPVVSGAGCSVSFREQKPYLCLLYYTRCIDFGAFRPACMSCVGILLSANLNCLAPKQGNFINVQLLNDCEKAT